MSRTYRRSEIEIPCNCGSEYRQSNRGHWYDQISWYLKQGINPEKVCYCGIKYDYFSRRNLKRDRKPYYKCNKVWKQIEERHRRARVQTAMAHNRYDVMPIFRRTNDWNWM